MTKKKSQNNWHFEQLYKKPNNYLNHLDTSIGPCKTK